MRSMIGYLFVLAAAILAVVLLLPVLGMIFLIVAGVVIVAVGALIAAPLLAKLPWFRDRIHVESSKGFRSVSFGQDVENHRQPSQEDPDVIDVQGRELPDSDSEPK